MINTKKQILSCVLPGDLFSDQTTMEDEFKKFSQKWHPDHGGDDEVMTKINMLHDLGKKHIKDGIWESKTRKVFSLKDNHKLSVHFLSQKEFELGTMFICNKSIVFCIIKKEFKDLFENADKITKCFKYGSVGYFSDDGIIERYLSNIVYLLHQSYILYTETQTKSFINNYDSIIFEGAQGLMLDQNYEYFPHVTHSNTGIKNIIELMNDFEICDNTLDIVYITRCYLTRHGNGPFPTETKEKPFRRIVDLTNLINEFQGSLRFGLLDLNLLKKNIDSDYLNKQDIKYTKNIAVTCLDQIDVDSTIKYIQDGKEFINTKEIFMHDLLNKIGNVDSYYTSQGLTRETIRENKLI
jgi:adenylosuccinate synthase